MGFEKIILEDLKLLKVEYDDFSCTSDLFPKMIEMCTDMIKKGFAYGDDTPIEQMRDEKANKIAGKNRDNSVDKNLKIWDEMQKGTVYGKTCCIRSKMDIFSDNGALRDPIMYRCKDEEHPKTKKKYNVYPSYDFACPIVDSLEGVTHAMRTTEYTSRDPQYYWFIEKMNLKRPEIVSYSRLNMTNTVLSKRKLTHFVETGVVSGWDDPRMPTVRGVLRRGLTVEGLLKFISAQGFSKNIVNIEWDKIWAMNKDVIDPITKRYFAVDEKNHVTINVEAKPDELKPITDIKCHPKEDLGTRTVYPSKQLLVEHDDARDFEEGINVVLINWGNLTIKKKHFTDGKLTLVDAVTAFEGQDFKKDKMK